MRNVNIREGTREGMHTASAAPPQGRVLFLRAENIGAKLKVENYGACRSGLIKTWTIAREFALV